MAAISPAVDEILVSTGVHAIPCDRYGACNSWCSLAKLEVEAALVGADLTILGTHEYATAHKHLIGTTDKLLAKTSTPILTVKL